MARYIDVEELKKWLERWKGYLDDDMIQRMQICVKDISTIEEQKKGKWVRDEFGSKCSCCGLYAYRDKFEKPWESNFCPNCGADMRGDGNDN